MFIVLAIDNDSLSPSPFMEIGARRLFPPKTALGHRLSTVSFERGVRLTPPLPV